MGGLTADQRRARERVTAAGEAQRASQANADEARVVRDLAVLEALGAGVHPAEVARWAGVTRQTVLNIAAKGAKIKAEDRARRRVERERLRRLAKEGHD